MVVLVPRLGFFHFTLVTKESPLLWVLTPAMLNGRVVRDAPAAFDKPPIGSGSPWAQSSWCKWLTLLPARRDVQPGHRARCDGQHFVFLVCRYSSTRASRSADVIAPPDRSLGAGRRLSARGAKRRIRSDRRCLPAERIPSQWKFCVARSSAARRWIIRTRRSGCSTTSTVPRCIELARELGCCYSRVPTTLMPRPATSITHYG